MEAIRKQLTVNKGGSGSFTYRTVLPKKWLKEMGIDENNKDIRLLFDGTKIIIEPVTKAIRLEFVYETMYDLVEEHKKELTDEEIKSEEVINNLIHVTLDKFEEDYLSFEDFDENGLKKKLIEYLEK